jgi:hypothetical protein
MTLRGDKEIRGADVPLPQIHNLQLKDPQQKSLLKGKKRAMVEDDEEDEDKDKDEEEQEEEEEEQKETVRNPTQTHS